MKAFTGNALGVVGPKRYGTSKAPKEKARIIIKLVIILFLLSGRSILVNTCVSLAPKFLDANIKSLFILERIP